MKLFKILGIVACFAACAACLTAFNSNTCFAEGESYTFFCGDTSRDCRIITVESGAALKKLTLRGINGESTAYPELDIAEFLDEVNGQIIFTEELTDSVLHAIYTFRCIDHRSVLTGEGQFSLGTKSLSDVAADLIQFFFNQIGDLIVKRASCAQNRGMIGNDVIGCARFNLTNTQHSRINRTLDARDDALDGFANLDGREDRVN